MQLMSAIGLQGDGTVRVGFGSDRGFDGETA